MFASRVLHHAPRPALALAAMARLAKSGGKVLLIDYQLHDNEALREKQADVWLGFSADELVGYAEKAGLENIQISAIDAPRCVKGLDGELSWQALGATVP